MTRIVEGMSWGDLGANIRAVWNYPWATMCMVGVGVAIGAVIF